MKIRRLENVQNFKCGNREPDPDRPHNNPLAYALVEMGCGHVPLCYECLIALVGFLPIKNETLANAVDYHLFNGHQSNWELELPGELPPGAWDVLLDLNLLDSALGEMFDGFDWDSFEVDEYLESYRHN